MCHPTQRLVHRYNAHAYYSKELGFRWHVLQVLLLWGLLETLWLVHTLADKCDWVPYMRKGNNLPKAPMTVCVDLLACIVTFIVDSTWYTPCSKMYSIMIPLGSFGGFQVMLTEVSVISLYISLDTGPGAVGWRQENIEKCILVKYWQDCNTVFADIQCV